MFVCVCARACTCTFRAREHTHTSTHTHVHEVQRARLLGHGRMLSVGALKVVIMSPPYVGWHMYVYHYIQDLSRLAGPVQ